uniref:Uncharacterized protein n=1 Tax=Glossina brevipalpis TaxID=37001 RepID=A0A1A9W556_9MUSC
MHSIEDVSRFNRVLRFRIYSARAFFTFCRNVVLSPFLLDSCMLDFLIFLLHIYKTDLKIKSKFYVKLQEFVQLFKGLLCPNLIASSLSSKRMLLSTRLFSSVASVTKASSTLRFSFAEVSITNSTSESIT